LQNADKKGKVAAMSTFTLIGLALMTFAIVLFGYQVMEGLLGMGTSNDYVYENIRFESVLGDGVQDWVDGISTPAIKDLAETVISLPLVVVLMGGAVLFFLIHMFRGPK
jgi:hypothetical protein